MIANQALQTECEALIYSDFKQEIQSAIKSRILWQTLTKVMDVGSHLFQGSTTILAFMSVAVSAPALSVVAGCAGVGATVCMSYSLYCKNQYSNQTKIIENMCSKINVVDILPDNSSELGNPTPAPTPAATPQRQTAPSASMLTAYTNSLTAPASPAVIPVDMQLNGSIAESTARLALLP